MTTIRPGSHILRLLQLLSTAGEIPTDALSLLGNERVLKALAHKLESAQELRFGKDGSVYTTKLLQISGKKELKTIRLFKGALPMLSELHPAALDYYMEAFQGHSFTGDRQHIWRNHRVAETLAACMAAGVEIRPYSLPPLQKAGIKRTVPDSSCFYIARNFKKTANDQPNKTMFTRTVGALFYSGGCYTVYNTRNAVMKWSGKGELKAARNLLELARMNAGLDDVSAALIFGQNADVALNTILESDKSRRRDLRFDRIFTSIHFIPLDANGVRLLKLLILPDWNERLLIALFDPGQRSYNRGSIEYDAVVNGTKILSHLNGDIARLIRFREALTPQTGSADVLCFPWQTGFIKAYLNGRAGLRELDIGAVEAALGI
jgi:hypothetical protein